MSDYFTSTKFWYGVAVVIAAYVLVWAGKMDATLWVTTALGASGIYTVGNLGDKKIEADKTS